MNTFSPLLSRRFNTQEETSMQQIPIPKPPDEPFHLSEDTVGMVPQSDDGHLYIKSIPN